jgi:Tfp pilus assembly protein PilF
MAARFRKSSLVVVLTGFLASAPAGATPRLPADDAEVLENLPAKASDPAAIEQRRLRAAADAAPGAEGPAARLARRYFELAMAEGDPRYVGYAQAALRAWPEAAAAPAEILLLRGMLRQYRHDFAGAMADFERTLAADPASVEARAWRAAIRMVQADYAGARSECGLLAAHASELHATACLAYVEATTGGARAAHDRLAAALARRSDIDPAFHAWVLTRLAEMSWRTGDAATAEAHFRKALGLGVDDNFLLAAYADFLLEGNRPGDVVALLRRWSRSDTLLLRLAIAARRLGLAEAEAYVRTLGERFADAGRRGEKLHLQEEARYLLELKGDARAALAAAAENYRTQREPRDAQVLIEAALAARDPAPAAPALQWLASSGFESARLRDAAARLKALAK